MVSVNFDVASAAFTVPPIAPFGTRVAIVAHVFYPDYIPRLKARFDRLPFPFDLFVTVPSQAIAKMASNTFEGQIRGNFEARIVPNRGRNFAPMLVEFGRDLLKYDALIHVHSKKSLYSGGERVEWSNFLLDGILSPGASSVQRNVLTSKNLRVGLSFPKTPPGVPFWANHWLKNVGGGQRLNDLLGLNLTTHGMVTYPMGGMFWVKPAAIRQILEFEWTYDLFEPETGQTDGTLSHAIERFIAPLCVDNGYRSIAYDPEAQKILLDKAYVLEDYKAFVNPIFDQALVDVDVLSLDFFDTLVHRTHPYDDLAKYLSAKELGLDEARARSFVALRNQCESELRSRHSELPGDVKITEVAPRFSRLLKSTLRTEVDPEHLVQLEVKFESIILRPKEDLCRVLRRRQALRKVTRIVSDTYYLAEHLALFLRSIGLKLDFLDIQASSMTGLRKDRGDFWVHERELLAGKTSTLHVGDNVVSDVQNPGDLAIPAMFVANSWDLAAMHGVKVEKSLDMAFDERNVNLHRIFQKQELKFPGQFKAGLQTIEL